MAKKAKPGRARKVRGVGETPPGRNAAKPRPAAGSLAAVKSASNDAFPIVGVGASAGGLEAFTELLKALPAKPGMAFVFILHMAPTHESMLPRLLSKTTTMPVVEVTDGMAVEPDHVYIIPPNAGMTISQSVLRLVARKETGKILAIDEFFWALAEDQKSAAIGVILSGTASDGAQGLRAIKAEGGITFAQDQLSARFPDMPLNAVATGCVDFCLPPDQIAAELARRGGHPYIGALREEVAERHAADSADESLGKICLTLRTATGVDFHLYKPATIARRVARRMALQRVSSRERYLQLLRESRAELEALYEDIFIHVTGFFRDAEALVAIRQTVLPKILESQQQDPGIRVWVPGCSSGEEVYSIAMLLLEELGDRASQARIQIFGTDIAERAIEQARTGIYPESAMTSVSAARRRRFFLKVESGFQIAKFVRDRCVFARHDVTKDPPFSRMDLISCRNVLIYLGQVLQKRVAETFHYALKPGGCLLLGKSESLSAHSNLFSLEDPKLKIFSRKPLAAPVYGSAAMAEYAKAERSPSGPVLVAPFDLRREAERVLLDQFVPAALVIDSDLQIVHFQGDTSRFLAPATGQPSFHLLRMVRPELVVALRTAIHEARKSGAAVRREGIRLKHNGSVRWVNLQVAPLQGGSAKQVDFLVVLEDSADRVRPEAGAGAPAAAKPKKSESAKVAQLLSELAAAQGQLRTIIEEHEATREEMTAVNEEIVSSNEELQSTNEELETAKEELQSSNEELITLNDELQNRNTELGQLTNDLSNLLVGVDIPIVILGSDLRIRRFTPVAEQVLNLIATDVGRPFTDLAVPLNVTNWEELADRVIEQRRVVEQDVQDREGRWFSLRMRPYQTAGQNVDGVLMALFDIDAVRRSLDEAREARNLAEAIVETVRAPLVILDSDLAVVKATQSFYDTFQTEPAETEGRGFLELAGGQWNRPPLRQLLLEILPHDTRLDDFEVSEDFPRLGRRTMILNARRIHRPSGRAALILLSFEDVTERRQTEMILQLRERVIQDASSQAIVSAGSDGRIVMANLRAAEMFGYEREELLDLPVEMMIPERLRTSHVAKRAAYFGDPGTRRMGVGIELTGCRKDGSEFPIAVTLSHIETRDGPLAIDIITDLTDRKEVETALRMSQERLSLAQEVAGIGIWEWDIQSNETLYSKEWGPLYGLAPGAQVASHEEWRAMIHPDDRQWLQETREHNLRTGQPYHTEFRVIWPDGSVHWLQGRGTAFLNEGGKPLRMLGVNMDITDRKRADEEREALLARLAAAQEEERRRISRELHDDLTQRLAGLAMELGGLATEFPAASERLKKRLRGVQGGVVRAAETARHVAYELHPSELDDLGLVAAARAYCEEMAREGVSVDFSSRGLPESLDREVASCLYRVIQQSLRNVVQHAKARQASVSLEGRGDRIVLRVRDTGVGFPAESLSEAVGLGILGMRERVRNVNGTFSLQSKPGEGTEVKVEIPLGGAVR